MKNLQDMGKQTLPLIVSNQSDTGGLLKTGVLSLLFHIVLIIFVILNLKTGTTKSGLPVYRVTIQPLLSQINSTPNPLLELPAPQPIPGKLQIKKEENRPKEEAEKSEPVKEPKQLPQQQEDKQTIRKPIPLPMVETSTLNTDSNLEKEEILPIFTALSAVERNKNISSELGGGDGIGTGSETGTRTGGSTQGGSGEGEGTGSGRRGTGWISSGEGSGRGKGGTGFSVLGKGTGTGKGGSRSGSVGGGSGGSGSGAVLPRYGENQIPSYPQEARNKGYQGKVLLQVEVLQNGRVGDVLVKESSGYEVLDQSALETMKKWRFIPAQEGGVAIPCWVNIPIKFQLR